MAISVNLNNRWMNLKFTFYFRLRLKYRTTYVSSRVKPIIQGGLELIVRTLNKSFLPKFMGLEIDWCYAIGNFSIPPSPLFLQYKNQVLSINFILQIYLILQNIKNLYVLYGTEQRGVTYACKIESFLSCQSHVEL